MAHRVSAAALHSAVTLKKSFSFMVRPPEELPSGRVAGLDDSEKCIAIIVDYATNIFELAVLRPELRYWQERLFAGTATAPQIGNFCQKVLDAYAKIPQARHGDKMTVTAFETPPQFMSRPVAVELSKAALEAARFLFHYYAVTPKRGEADPDVDRLRVAKIVESCIEISRAIKALPSVEAAQARLRSGQITVEEVKKVLRELGVLLEYLPGYENKEEELKLL